MRRRSAARDVAAMRESISAIAAERKEAAAAAERDTFEYERTMEQVRLG